MQTLEAAKAEYRSFLDRRAEAILRHERIARMAETLTDEIATLKEERKQLAETRSSVVATCLEANDEQQLCDFDSSLLDLDQRIERKETLLQAAKDDVDAHRTPSVDEAKTYIAKVFEAGARDHVQARKLNDVRQSLQEAYAILTRLHPMPWDGFLAWMVPLDTDFDASQAIQKFLDNHVVSVESGAQQVVSNGDC